MVCVATERQKDAAGRPHKTVFRDQGTSRFPSNNKDLITKLKGGIPCNAREEIGVAPPYNTNSCTFTIRHCVLCPQMLDQRMEQFEQEKKKWETHKQAAAAEGKTFEDAEPIMDGAKERAWQV